MIFLERNEYIYSEESSLLLFKQILLQSVQLPLNQFVKSISILFIVIIFISNIYIIDDKRYCSCTTHTRAHDTAFTW